MNRTSLAVIAIAVAAIVLLPSAYYILQGEERDDDDTAGTVTITDAAGRDLKVSTNLTRVAVVNTYTAEVMRALGVDTSIIVGISTDFQLSSIWDDLDDRRVVQTSAHGEPDVEAMLDLKIQALFTFGTHQQVNIPSLEEKLGVAGIAVIGLDFWRYNTLYSDITTMGKIFQKEKEAAELIAGMEAVEDLIESRVGNIPIEDRPTVIMEHHSSSARDPRPFGALSTWTDIIELAGGVNIFGEEPGSVVGVDPESIPIKNPDYYFLDGMVVDMGYGRSNTQTYDTIITALSKRDGFSVISAVIYGDMYLLAGEFSGPMMVYGAGVIASILHPDLFTEEEKNSFISDYFRIVHNVEVTGTLYYPES